MIAAEHGTVSDIEILWVALAVAGMIFTLLNLGEARADVRWVKTSGITNGRRVLARTGLWMELCRFFIQAIFCAIGILAMFLHDPPNHMLPLTQEITRAFITWGLIISSGLLTFKTYLARRVRKALSVERQQVESRNE